MAAFRRLEVSIDHFVMGGGIEGAGTPAELWERDVFPDFSRQIREHIGESVHSAIAGEFSTSDNVSRAAQEIVLMSAMKNYFSYGCTTMCGIPSVSLHGSREDWASLRGRAEQLGTLMLPEFAERWLGNLLPVLDQFIASYDGQVPTRVSLPLCQSCRAFTATNRAMLSHYLTVTLPSYNSSVVLVSLSLW